MNGVWILAYKGQGPWDCYLPGGPVSISTGNSYEVALDAAKQAITGRLHLGEMLLPIPDPDLGAILLNGLRIPLGSDVLTTEPAFIAAWFQYGRHTRGLEGPWVKFYLKESS